MSISPIEQLHRNGYCEIAGVGIQVQHRTLNEGYPEEGWFVEYGDCIISQERKASNREEAYSIAGALASHLVDLLGLYKPEEASE